LCFKTGVWAATIYDVKTKKIPEYHVSERYENKKETLTETMNRSPDERHT
jgi:hypothetical protein